MNFKVDGKSIKPTLPITVELVKEILDKLPDGDLITAKGLTQRLHRSTDKSIRIKLWNRQGWEYCIKHYHEL